METLNGLSGTEKISIIEWRGKVTAILEHLAEQIKDLHIESSKYVHKDVFDSWKTKFDNCEITLVELRHKIIDVDGKLTNYSNENKAKATSRASKIWELTKVALTVIITMIVTFIINRLIGK